MNWELKRHFVVFKMKKTTLTILAITAGLMLNSCGGANDKKAEAQENAQLAPNDITGNFHLPEKQKVGEGALVHAELIYSLDDRPTPQVHASTLVETPSGIVAAFFAGTHEKILM